MCPLPVSIRVRRKVYNETWQPNVMPHNRQVESYALECIGDKALIEMVERMVTKGPFLVSNQVRQVLPRQRDILKSRDWQSAATVEENCGRCV